MPETTPVKHEGLHTHRLRTNYLERVMSEHWADLCEDGHLEYLLSLDNKWRPVSERDAVIAATVIQWLGTSVGQNFLERCGFTRPNL